MTTTRQRPGCLPPGKTEDSILTREEFRIWQGFTEGWLSKHIRRLPGVIRESKKVVRIHPRTYLERRLKK